MHRTLVPLALCLGLAVSLRAVDPVVSNVLAQQRAGTKLVDIIYDVADADSATLTVTIAISNDDGATWTVPCTHATGDLGAGVAPGTGKTIVWDAGADWDGQWSDQMAVEVTANDTPGGQAGEYLAIDVLAGPGDGAVYPVTYLSQAPADLLTNDVWRTTTILLRRVPGTAPYVFSMGSPTGELGRDSDEYLHQVTLTQAFFPFYVGVFEVTQKQWERVTGAWPSYFNNTSVRDGRPVERVSYNDIRGSSLGAGWPANSAVDAGSFLGKLRARTSPQLAAIDLPTEAQWEAACRAGTTTALNNGTNLVATGQDPNMDLLGRYWYNGGSGYSHGCGLQYGTAKAGTYLVNGWGLYDMHGDVWEWCLDWYQSNLGTSPVSDPRGPTVPGSYRVTRGGSWLYYARGCRSAYRSGYSPVYTYLNIGFRLALPAGQ
jgi:formylglycine-generating enzyme required for sulfatase activity